MQKADYVWTGRSWTDRLVDIAGPILAALWLALHHWNELRNFRSDFANFCDFKTLFVSVRAMVLRLNPYDIPQVEALYKIDGVHLPASWFGNLPVYPPFTLALLAPLGKLTIPQAGAVWFVLAIVCFAATFALLMRRARDTFHIGPLGRVVMLAAIACYPLVAFVLSMANISIFVCGLCLFAVWFRGPAWLRGLLLGLALVAKPHIAFWVLIACCLYQATRRVAWWAFADASLFVAATSLIFLAQGRLVSIWQQYRAILTSEMASGASMSGTTFQALPMGGHVTSATALANYFGSPWWHILVYVLALAAVAVSVWYLLQRRGSGNDVDLALTASVLSCVGMIVTYHRLTDTLCGLFLLLPLLVSKHYAPLAPRAAMVVCLLLLGHTFGHPAKKLLLSPKPLHLAMGHFLLFKQGAALSIVLVFCVVWLAASILEKKEPV